MLSKNLVFAVLLVLTVLIGVVYYAWNNSRPIYYINLPYQVDQSESIKKILQEIDGSGKDVRVVTQTSTSRVVVPPVAYDNQVCSNYKTVLKGEDLSAQATLVSEAKVKLLSGAAGATEAVYKYTQKGVSDRYASHIIPLVVAGLVTDGDILELGIGKYSTPALNAVAKEQKKFIMSIESELNWMQNFVHLNDSVNHLIIPFSSECARSLNMNRKWGLVFVDHLQGEKRHQDIIKYAEKAQIVVAHDSEKNAQGYYMYDKAYPSFKYHCKSSLKYPDGSYLSTSLLSNYVSFEDIEKILKSVETHLVHIVCDQNMKRRRK